MLPAVVVSLAGIPVNAHGKRDYTALPVPDIAELERGDFTPPQSPLEQYLVNLWTNALRVQPIGIHDNFFSLGGDSLQATKLITQIQQEYPSDMPLLALFFQEPTIASLCADLLKRDKGFGNQLNWHEHGKEIEGFLYGGPSMNPVTEQYSGVASLAEDLAAEALPKHLVRIPGEQWAFWRWICLRGAGFASDLPQTTCRTTSRGRRSHLFFLEEAAAEKTTNSHRRSPACSGQHF